MVAWAQACLAQLIGPWVPQDGIIGPGTRQAIAQFQGQQQLPPTGVLDDTTLEALQAACGGRPEALPAGEIPDSEAESATDTALLAFRIPEAPYSDAAFKRISKSIELFEAVHTAMEIFKVELPGLLGLSSAAIAPLIIWLEGILEMGAAYAGAWAEISRHRVRSGFAQGVVTGADRRTWRYVKSLFWEYRPEPYVADAQAGRIAQTAFNTGLAAGFLQGRELAKNPKKMKFF
jgi:hypothetical protein